MKNHYIIFMALGLAFIGVTFLPGCYYDNEEELYELWYAQNVCDTLNVSYSQDIKPIIDGQCATSGCHVAGGTGNGIFDNYNGVKAKVDNGSMMDRVVMTRDMPPSVPLSDCNVQKFQAWINAGAPNN
jgi:hypothetical protein